jgi:hypothetical protein
MTKARRMTKEEALRYWEGLQEADFEDTVSPISYKTTGSRYGMDGIRIDGTRKFIDSVLARLKGLLVWESAVTRLELNYTETVDRETKEPTGNWVCYVRVHMRGGEGVLAQGFFGGARVKENAWKLAERLGIE